MHVFLHKENILEKCYTDLRKRSFNGGNTMSTLRGMTFDEVASLDEFTQLIATGFPTRASWEEMDPEDFQYFMSSVYKKFGTEGIRVVETNQETLGLRHQK